MKNLAVVSEDAKLLLDIFEQGELDKLYLNFSDPWPKSGMPKDGSPIRSFWIYMKKY